ACAGDRSVGTDCRNGGDGGAVRDGAPCSVSKDTASFSARIPSCILAMLNPVQHLVELAEILNRVQDDTKWNNGRVQKRARRLLG
ncbi:MAG: hypothetical protein AAFV29_10505, partial [Myxococcota bacterium]